MRIRRAGRTQRSKRMYAFITMRAWKPLLWIIVAICSVGAGANHARSQTPLPASCIAAGPEPCVYQSDLNYPVGVIDPIMLSDPARGNYTIPLLIRYPIGAVGRRPVVIWNHGGNPSPQGRQRSAEW